MSKTEAYLERHGDEFDEKTLKCIDVKFLENVSTCFGFIKAEDLERFKKDIEFETYSLKNVDNYPILTTNGEYGFNLDLITTIYKEIKPKEIMVPTKFYPAHFKADGGHVLVLAPLTMEGVDETFIHKLNKPIQTLNKFW